MNPIENGDIPASYVSEHPRVLLAQILYLRGNFHSFHSMPSMPFPWPTFYRRFEVDASRSAGRGAGSFRCCHILGSVPLKGGMSMQVPCDTTN